jgi:hypothetical protein
MLKVKVRWSGFIGSPGWSNFYFNGPDDSFTTAADADIAADRVEAFFTAIKLKFPSGVSFAVQPDVEVVSESTGDLLNVHNAGARAPITSTATSAAYSGVSGACITWRTAGVRNGRRVRGRTFLVPLVNGIYQSDGTIDNTHVNDFVTQATTLALPGTSNLSMGVWARPTAPGASDGDWHAITSVTVPDMAAVLRSRRG